MNIKLKVTWRTQIIVMEIRMATENSTNISRSYNLFYYHLALSNRFECAMSL